MIYGGVSWRGLGLPVQFFMYLAEGAHLFGGVVGGAHQRATLHPLEADLQAEFLDLGELLGSVIALNGQVLFAGLKVLADGEDVHLPAALVAHHRFDLRHGLAKTDHDTGLGEHFGCQLLGVGQRGSRPFVAVLGLDLLEEARYGFHVVVEDLWASVHDNLEGFDAALEIGDKHFDGAAGMQLADAVDDHSEDGRAAVFAVIAVDAGDHRVLEVHGFDRLGDAIRLQPVQGGGCATFDVAKAASAGANIAHHQEGGCSRTPTLAHIGA